MSIDVKNMFRKTVVEPEKTIEQNPQFRKSLRERLEAARAQGGVVDRIPGHDVVFYK